MTMPTRMPNPPHLGEIRRDTVLADDRTSVNEFVRKLGVSRYRA
jgi:plasmid maintenance system antidote protein VapI